MIIHLCVDCGKVSINRIAADDITETVCEVYEASLESGLQMRLKLEENGIQALGAADRHVVHTRLFGHASPVPCLSTYLLT